MTKRKIIIEIDEVVNATDYPYHLHIRMEKDGVVIAEQKGLLFASMICHAVVAWFRDNQAKINIGK